jgi:2-polyprenyl-6-methoxyphenol hydroxylase-like FAD-dependent oxidoreductase
VIAQKDAEILIVGAGPVGLTAAIELTRRGFKPHIIEKEAGPHTQSRALAINPRTLDIMEPSGATARLLNAGSKVQAVNVRTPGRLLFRLETRLIPHPFRKYMLVFPQAETERELIAALGGRRKIEWETELTGLKLNKDGPKVTLRRKGRSETMTPDIVIGADGAHSAVRKALGIGFTGEAYEHDWGLLDAHVSGLPENELHVFDLSPLLVGFIPIRGDMFRIVADTEDVLGTLPPQVKVKDIVWQSRFRISHRQVETCQTGMVFLAGDAAHIHSPLGGRGMNLGIEDAAWLAYLIETGETARFTELRHPVAKQVLMQVDTATRFISSDGAVATFLRRWVAPLLARREFAQRYALRNIAGLASPAPPWLE